MNAKVSKKVFVVGAGAWGTALACAFVRAGHQVTLWALEPEVVQSVNMMKRNQLYLPDVPLPESLQATGELAEGANADIVVLVSPAQFLRDTCEKLAEHVTDTRTPLIVCSKGIEQYSLKLMSEVVVEIFPENPLLALSGPTFADEVARGQATACTLACEDIRVSKALAELLSNLDFRIYYSDDLIGAQIGGAVKNVIAIACGIALGRGMGRNACAAIIARGLSEMRHLCVAKGGKPETVMGLSGAGDLILTCTSEKSRNMSLGKALGEGKTIEEVEGSRGGKVSEGVASAQSVTDLARQLGITMPICQSVYALLYGDAEMEKIASELLERPLKAED